MRLRGFFEKTSSRQIASEPSFFRAGRWGCSALPSCPRVPVGRFSGHRRELSIHLEQLVGEVRPKHYACMRGLTRLRPGLPCFVQLIDTIGGNGQFAKPTYGP